MVKSEATAIATKYGDVRRTTVVADVTEMEEEAMVPNDDSIVTLSERGYIKRMPLSTFAEQNRGTRGKAGAKMRDNDTMMTMVQCRDHDQVLMFSETGRCYIVKAFQIPKNTRTSMGTPLRQLGVTDKILNITTLDPRTVRCLKNSQIWQTCVVLQWPAVRTSHHAAQTPAVNTQRPDCPFIHTKATLSHSSAVFWTGRRCEARRVFGVRHTGGRRRLAGVRNVAGQDQAYGAQRLQVCQAQRRADRYQAVAGRPVAVGGAHQAHGQRSSGQLGWLHHPFRPGQQPQEYRARRDGTKPTPAPRVSSCVLPHGTGRVWACVLSD
jgi:hypothetical protein